MTKLYKAFLVALAVVLAGVPLGYAALASYPGSVGVDGKLQIRSTLDVRDTVFGPWPGHALISPDSGALSVYDRNEWVRFLPTLTADNTAGIEPEAGTFFANTYSLESYLGGEWLRFLPTLSADNTSVLSPDPGTFRANTDSLSVYLGGVWTDVPSGVTGIGNLIGIPIGDGTGAYTGLNPTDGNFAVGDGTTYVPESGDTARISMGVGTTDDVSFKSASLGVNGVGGTEGSLTLRDGANPGSGETLSYTKWNSLNDTTGIVKCDGAGNFSAASSASDYIAYDAGLADLAGLAVTDGNFAVGDGSNWVAENGATARTSLGLGSVENTALSTWAGTSNVTTLGTITTGVWNAGAVTSSGAITGDSLSIGGGYGSTGLSVTNAGALSCDGNIITGGGVTCTGLAVNGNTWSTKDGSTNAFDIKNYGATATGNIYYYTTSRGSLSSPSQSSANDLPLKIQCCARDNSATPTARMVAIMYAQATEAPTSSSSAGQWVFQTTPTSSTTPATALTIQSDKTVYCADVCSAASFTDRTPGYDGDALTELSAIKNDAHGNIDHATLPALARKKIKVTEQKPVLDAEGKPRVGDDGIAMTEPVEREEDGRDLGAMISFLTAVCQEQQEQIDALTERVKALEIELQIKPKFPVND